MGRVRDGSPYPRRLAGELEAVGGSVVSEYVVQGVGADCVVDFAIGAVL